MRYWFISLLFVACAAYSHVNYSEWLSFGEKEIQPGRSYLSADPSFSLKFYDTYDKFAGNFAKCLNRIFEYYSCKERDISNKKIKSKTYNYKQPEAELAWLNIFPKSAQMMEAQKKNALLKQFGAIYLYTVDSGAFSNELGRSGSPGIWSCYFEKLIYEHKVINEETRNQDSFPQILYSGLYNSYQYGITDDLCKMKIDVGSNITVSGFFSTTPNIDTAISFMYPSMGPGKVQKNPVLLFVTPLEKSQTQAAAIRQYSYYQTTEEEYLYPTNVRFNVTKIEKAPAKYYPAKYIIHVEETPTTEKFIAVKGKDPNYKEFNNYKCGKSFLSQNIW